MQSKFIFECQSTFMCNPTLFLNAKVLLCVIQLYFFKCQSTFMCNPTLFLNTQVFLCVLLWVDCDYFPRRRKNIPESSFNPLLGMFCYQ